MTRTPVKVIAEIGINHNGNLEKAYKLAQYAIDCGADSVKFQTAVPELVQTINAPKAKYQTNKDNDELSALEMSKGFHLKLDDYIGLKKFVEKSGKEFLSTAFDNRSIEFLHSIGMKTFKIPSGEITNLPYLVHIALVAEKIIISTGLATIEEIRSALEIFKNIDKKNITIMQCDSAYPAQTIDANILAMQEMGNIFKVAVGYSDHTLGPYASYAAVALGAEIIEKHITINKLDSGPDHKSSMTIGEFKEFIDGIREIEKSLGNHVKQVTKAAMENIAIVRRGIYLAKPKKRGDIIEFRDLITLRPENGTSPMNIKLFIGKKLTVNKNFQDPINLNEVE